MSSCPSSYPRLARRKPLATSVAALFAVAVAPTFSLASTWTVTSCAEGSSGDIPTKTGTLRFAVANAASGDTIQMSGLAPSDLDCGGGALSTITLTTSEIAVTQEKLTLAGPGLSAGGDYLVTIKQTALNSRVILHSYPGSTGHLYVEGLRVGYASISGAGQVHGGCIASLNGAVTLTNVHVDHCYATTTGLKTDVPKPHVYGGGVFAKTGLTITGGVLYHNAVTATHLLVHARGGCAMTYGPFDMNRAIVAGCSANGPPGGLGVRGGALELTGASTIITNSLIAKSQTTNNVGGVDINNGTGGLATATISNSSIAYNSASYLFGGLYANADHVNLNNSTVVLNTAGQSAYTYNSHTYNAAPGVSIISLSGSGTFSLQSTIIANNSTTPGGTQEDLSFDGSTGLIFAASNSLVRVYQSDVTLPAGQVNLPAGTCPMLGHVRNNGGGTYTVAPQSGSPVIDAGNNVANDPHTGVPALYDQRGPGYPRVSNGIADIGAHEVQKADIVFYTEFETGCE